MALSHPKVHDKNLLLFFVGSVLVHLVALVVWGLVSSRAPSRPNLDDLVVKTTLVKLGKKRDKKMLPRVAKPKAQKKRAETPKEPPKEPPKKEVPPVEVAPEKAPPPAAEAPKVEETKTSAADILNQFNDENEEPEPPVDLNVLIKDITDDDEGNPEGTKVGTEITGKLKADYNDKVKALVRAKLTAPSTLTDQDRIRLKTVLEIRIGSDGSLLSSSIAKASGNSLFDNASLRAAKTANFPPPPLAVRAFYATGISFNVCPVRCN
ncbi:MAG: TonB C-terminal domain-containing protein [Deltaproteobacteria bacterium]|nr:TonB C-terminal domain-containing protein [Deltaproteobacteria bacterium]